MPRLCCGCLSRKTRKSFPIHEKKQDVEINKVFIRHVENIRITPPLTPPIINSQIEKKTISKTIIKKKSNQQTIKEIPIPVSNLFEKSIELKTPSSIEDYHDKTITNTVSSWPSSTDSDLTSQTSSEYQSYLEQKTTISQTKNISNDMKFSGKSKLILENVRKMIKDQNIQ